MDDGRSIRAVKDSLVALVDGKKDIHDQNGLVQWMQLGLATPP